MNPESPDRFASMVFAFEVANVAYNHGKDLDAVKQYLDTANRARQLDNVSAEMISVRRMGNTLMWAGRTAEAQAALVYVATCRNATVDSGIIYAALTDLVMLSLYHYSLERIDQLSAEADAYLESINRETWSHRGDLLASMRSQMRGEFAEAARLANRANEKQRMRMECPHYAELSHLKCMLRPAFSCHDVQRVEQLLQQGENLERSSTLDGRIWHWAHLLLYRLTRTKTGANAPLLEHALAAARISASEQIAKDTVFDVGRGLIVGGRIDVVDSLRWETANNWHYERALFAFDLAINRLLLAEMRPPIDLDIGSAPENAPPVKNEAARPELLDELRRVTTELKSAAAQEALRLECEYPRERAQGRLNFVTTIVPTLFEDRAP